MRMQTSNLIQLAQPILDEDIQFHLKGNQNENENLDSNIIRSKTTKYSPIPNPKINHNTCDHHHTPTPIQTPTQNHDVNSPLDMINKSIQLHLFIPCKKATEKDLNNPDFEFIQPCMNFSELGYITEWNIQFLDKFIHTLKKFIHPSQPITYHYIHLRNISKVISSILPQKKDILIFNLTDGTEWDGWPGVSVIRELESHQFNFTGAKAHFFALDTQKKLMKEWLIQMTADTPKSVDLSNILERSGNNMEYIQKKFEGIQFPVIVKVKKRERENIFVIYE